MTVLKKYLFSSKEDAHAVSIWTLSVTSYLLTNVPPYSLLNEYLPLSRFFIFLLEKFSPPPLYYRIPDHVFLHHQDDAYLEHCHVHGECCPADDHPLQLQKLACKKYKVEETSFYFNNFFIFNVDFPFHNHFIRSSFSSSLT